MGVSSTATPDESRLVVRGTTSGVEFSTTPSTASVSNFVDGGEKRRGGDDDDDDDAEDDNESGAVAVLETPLTPMAITSGVEDLNEG